MKPNKTLTKLNLKRETISHLVVHTSIQAGDYVGKGKLSRRDQCGPATSEGCSVSNSYPNQQ